MKIVVTGAAGFIGRYAVRSLVGEGHDVFAVTTRRSVSDTVKRYIDGSELVRVKALCEIPENIIKGNVLIHCAWSNVQDMNNASHYAHAHIQLQFISKIALFEPKKVIVTGTCFEFASSVGPVSVFDQPSPMNAYGHTKNFIRCASEAILRDKSEIELIWARLFHVYGEGQHDKSFYSQLLAAISNRDKFFNMSEGEQLYDYMRVEEVAKKLSFLCANKAPSIVHICNGYPVSLRRLAEKIIQERDASIELNLGYYPYRSQDPLSLWGRESFDLQMDIFQKNNSFD